MKSFEFAVLVLCKILGVKPLVIEERKVAEPWKLEERDLKWD